MDSYAIGTQAGCSTCKRNIVYTGVFWKHVDGAFRHPARPASIADRIARAADVLREGSKASDALDAHNQGGARNPIESALIAMNHGLVMGDAIKKALAILEGRE